jgi:hypothetical protein
MKDLFLKFFSTLQPVHSEENVGKIGQFLYDDPESYEQVLISDAGIAFLGLADAVLRHDFNAWAAVNGYDRFHPAPDDYSKLDEFTYALLAINVNPELDTSPFNGHPDHVAHLVVLTQVFAPDQIDALAEQAHAIVQRIARETNHQLN